MGFSEREPGSGGTGYKSLGYGFFPGGAWECCYRLYQDIGDGFFSRAGAWECW
jgi:hypothetical protein